METSFNKGLAFSVVGHLALVLVFFVPRLIWNEQPLIQESIIRVDLVGLPMKEQKIPKTAPDEKPETTTTAPSTPPAATPAEEIPASPSKSTPAQPAPPAKSMKSNSQKRERKQDQAVNRLKQLDALEKLEQTERRQAVLGNEISKGNQLTGLAKLEAASYIQEVERHVKDNWIIPKWLAEKGYQVQIQVRFNEAGQILGFEIKKPSGNRNFDEIALSTLQKSVPFPKPPDRLVRQMEVVGILFGFPD